VISHLLAATNSPGPWKGALLFSAALLFHSYREYRSDQAPTFGIHPLFHFLLGVAYVLAAIAMFIDTRQVSLPLLIGTGLLHLVAVVVLVVNAIGKLPRPVWTHYQAANGNTPNPKKPARS
jgi:hypothetical protein